MNLNQRRPTGTHNNPLIKMTRGDIEYCLSQTSYRLEVRREHVGQWNEGRLYVLVGNGVEHDLDYVSKGDRPNWDAIWAAIEQAMIDTASARRADHA